MAERLRHVSDVTGRIPARTRWIAAAVLGAAFLLWLVLFAPRLLIPPASDASLRDVTDAAKRHELQDSRLKLQNDVRNTLLQGLGGLAVLVGASFTYRQLRIAREGQVTERFTRAIDQLGDENQDVRLGGIYALERIANDSPPDRATIAEVLTAFVRGHAPWPPSRPGQLPEDTPTDDIRLMRSWAPDVQAVLTVLGRRKPPIGPPERLDLAGTDLRGAVLHGDLRGATFWGARLQRAVLSFAQLQETTFIDAVMHGAQCYGAELQEAVLTDAELQGAWLLKANLQGAQPLRAQMQGVMLEDAQLQEAILQDVQLQKADLNHAELQGAWLHGAQLQEADLSGTQLQGAHCNAETVWPDGFDWKAAGAKLEDWPSS